MSALERAKKEGIDLSLLDKSLSMTPTERIERFLKWLRFAEELRKGKRRNAGDQRDLMKSSKK